MSYFVRLEVQKIDDETGEDEWDDLFVGQDLSLLIAINQATQNALNTVLEEPETQEEFENRIDL